MGSIENWIYILEAHPMAEYNKKRGFGYIIVWLMVSFSFSIL